MTDYFWFAICIALNASLLLVLAFNVSRLRIKYRISLGDGGNKVLMAAIRTHCNNVEQIPVYALTILGLTFLGETSLWLSILVIGFSSARFLHAFGMLYRVHLARRIGAAFTYLFQVFAIVELIRLLVV